MRKTPKLRRKTVASMDADHDIASLLKEAIILLRGLGISPVGSQPFLADGKIVQLIGAAELTRYIPRSEDTLIAWAKKGLIPASRMPSTKRKGKVTWLFNLLEVKSAIDGYKL